ncbi:syntaxin-42 isoform X2 [Cucumis melo var. makuwa]|uniref:Syntaxin-42 isoform X2 n=1 Tax=Cucumis melo var. makuwa TaxID=1194695 RepID=A0A5A7TV31_CUCMM|nr:syntaxin-42 isoform X2 [Cucumis melo var. makuwa]TYK19263.1 syntaxin-42 isoform X2 [Cucumis melo var. makuwa]
MYFKRLQQQNEGYDGIDLEINLNGNRTLQEDDGYDEFGTNENQTMTLDEQHIQGREKEIKKVVKFVNELTQIMKGLSTLVMDQVMVLNIKDFFVVIPSLNDYFSPLLTNSSTDLFPTSDSPPNPTPCPLPISELTQSYLISALLNLPYVPCEELESCIVRHSTRIRETPPQLKDYHCFSSIISLVEPSSYEEANTNPLWQQAMNAKFRALEKTYTWDYVDLPFGKKPIGCKWIYKTKTLIALLNDTKHDLCTTRNQDFPDALKDVDIKKAIFDIIPTYK